MDRQHPSGAMGGRLAAACCAKTASGIAGAAKWETHAEIHVLITLVCIPAVQPPPFWMGQLVALPVPGNWQTFGSEADRQLDAEE